VAKKELRPLSQEQSDVWHYLHDQSTTKVFFGGGAGPGKSFLGCLFECVDSAAKAGSRGLIAREKYEDLRKTTMLTFFEVAGMLGYVEGEHFRYNAQEHTVYWRNGSITFFDHLQSRPGDPEFNRLGSREYTRVFVDEGPDCQPKAIEVLETRIRFRLTEFGTPGKMLITGNSGYHWCRDEFVLNKKNEPVELPDNVKVVLTTYLSNPDPSFREAYGKKLEKIRDPHTKSRLMYGDWMSSPKTGMEFIPEFDSNRHVRSNQYDPSLALHYTLDFNSAPYMTLLVAQIKQQEMGRWSVDFLKEYCLSHPLANTKAVCQAFAKDLQTGCFKGHKAGLFMYGDRSGKNKTSMATEAVRHDFDQAEAILGRWMHGNSDRVLRANPPHAKAAAFMGHCFGGRIGIDVTLDSSMHTAISDHVHLKQGADGGILKEYVTDPLTKVRYEKWGHCVQAAYYLVISAFRETHYDEMEELAGDVTL
jgi:phage terminase large subunit